MNKKLLQKTSKVYLLYSVIILTISAPLFYYITEKLYIEEIDETLMLQKNEFLSYSLPKLTITEVPKWNEYNINSKIEKFNNRLKNTLFFNAYFDTLDLETEPYRELNSPIFIQGKPFIYSIKINLVETEDLVASIALIFLAVISMLLIGLYYITKRLSLHLWKPFYETLKQIENFEIDKSQRLNFNQTKIEEFNRLNNSIEKLIHKNTKIYHSQKEFIENAAHELQTPLAIFQAKIDQLIQSADFTQTQNEILNSLNESISRLNRLNKNLLLLSKVESDNYSEKQPVFLNDIIAKHLDFFNEQALSKNLKIKIENKGNLLIHSNIILTEVLITNLFLNAIKHNKSNGFVFVKLEEKTIIFSNSGQENALNEVTLFNRFSKINTSTDGNGLGLAIVKKIVEINHWKITYTFSEQLHSFTIKF